MKDKYSDKDVAIYALNYAIDKIHGNNETFKQYIKRSSELRNVKANYNEEEKYTFEELDIICTKYGNDSMLDFNIVFDKWFKIYLRHNKIKKILGGLR